MKRFKPVVLIYDLNNKLVDEAAALLGNTGRYTSINTYNEGNAMDAVRQYDRGFGMLTNKLACIITGWNNYKKPRDQFLYHLRALERKSPLRQPTPVILISEDHREDLKRRALDSNEGGVIAYLHPDTFKDSLVGLMAELVDNQNAREMNQRAMEEFVSESLHEE